MKIKKLNSDAIEVLRIMKMSNLVQVDSDEIRKNMSNPAGMNYAIRRLREEGIIKSVPDLMDMRSVHYILDEPLLNELKKEGLINV